jgi:PleD family two-component response regulator
MDVRLRKARAIAMAFLGAALILAGPWVGWWPILILVGLIVAWRLVQGVTDAVLKDVAYRIRKELRAYDLAYRLGGEEFVVLLPGATREGAGELAERLRRAVEGEAVEQIPVTASFGVAASGREGLAFRMLFEAADEALYRSKAAGRNRVCMAADGASEPSLA